MPGYETCVFELTEKQFAQNNYEPINLYSDTPKNMNAFLEYCQTSGKKLCNTILFQVGTEVKAKYDTEGATRLIFENDSEEDATFQIEISNLEGTSLTAVGGAINCLGVTTTLIAALLSSLSF